MSPRIRLQLHKAKGSFEMYYWQLRSMDGRVLVESPMYPTLGHAVKAIKEVDIKFDPLRVVYPGG